LSKQEFTVSDAHSYNQSRTARWIVAHLLHHKGYLISAISATIITNILYATTPLLIGDAFNTVLQVPPDPRRLATLALGILGVMLASGATSIAGRFAIEILGKRMERDARAEIYLNLLGKSQTFHNRQRVGALTAHTTNDVFQLNSMVTGLAVIFNSLANIVITSGFIWALRPQLLLMPWLFTLALLISIAGFVRKLMPVTSALQAEFAKMNAGLTETVAGMSVVKSSAQERQERTKFERHVARYRDLFVQQGRIQARYLPTLLLNGTFALALGHALLLFLGGALRLGDVITYMKLLDMLRVPTDFLLYGFSLTFFGISAAERILALLKTETELDANGDGFAQPISGALVFENVTFRYGDTPILKNISFRAAPGQTIAIVGQTGAGKSTLTKLVNRIYDVEQGRILIDNVDLRSWNLQALRSQIAMIDQDVFLFSRAIAENIAFGLGQQSEQATIMQAAQAAQAHDFIASFRDGYATIIGERGITLSGGQRQRIAIARALITNPRMLILDDSTSAIDSATEDAIQQAMGRLLQGRTTLLITNRLAQIRNADMILVLQHGELIDQGTHTELLERCGLYRRIFARHAVAVS
jgi:ATP-binding cassette, subfamily B, bacterial